jgi:RNA polymerase sigma-70 factor (ECF subfamily)
VKFNREHPISDRELVQQVLDGNQQAFKLVVERSERIVAQIVCRTIPNKHDWKDIVQETYLKAYRSLGNFQHSSKLTTWIATIAYNTCIDYLRRKKIVHDIHHIAERPGEISDNVLERDRSALLEQAISRLPPVYRTLITLFHKEELSYEEIVEITGMPEGTIKNYLFRARKKLKETLLFNYRKEDI